MNIEQRNEPLQRLLETEMGGVQVYETVLTCVLNADRSGRSTSNRQGGMSVPSRR